MSTPTIQNVTEELILRRLDALIAEAEADDEAQQAGRLDRDSADYRAFLRAVSLSNISYWIRRAASEGQSALTPTLSQRERGQEIRP